MLNHSSFWQTPMAVGVAFVLATAPGLAEPTASAPDPAAVALAKSLPAPLLKTILRGTSGFTNDMADMIASYGGDQGLTESGIGWMIQADRAEARARARLRFAAADLDDDGIVTRAEIDKRIKLLAKGGRGRLDLDFRAADLDKDQHVSADEIARFAAVKAVATLSEEQADSWQATMQLDLNADGYLLLDEVVAAVGALQGLEPELAKKGS